MRIAIVGGPRTGKTTMANMLAKQAGARVRHTDDVIGLGWSEASEEVADWLDYPGPIVVEGVAVARALRKWLAGHPDGRPVDRLIVLRRPLTETLSGHDRMAAGIATVLDEIRDELVYRGVLIEVR